MFALGGEINIIDEKYLNMVHFKIAAHHDHGLNYIEKNYHWKRSMYGGCVFSHHPLLRYITNKKKIIFIPVSFVNLVPRALRFFGHVVGETEGSGRIKRKYFFSCRIYNGSLSLISACSFNDGQLRKSQRLLCSGCFPSQCDHIRSNREVQRMRCRRLSFQARSKQ